MCNASETAVFPLAVPSIAGPGAMLAAVLQTENQRFADPARCAAFGDSVSSTIETTHPDADHSGIVLPVTSRPGDTCWTVLHAASKGNASARSTFARSYEPAIRGFLEARWRGRMLAAEIGDASQEVFVECLKPGGVLERANAEHGDFRALLGAVTRNVARRFEERAIERGRIRPEDSAWLQHVAADETGQATVFDRSWAYALVEEASERHKQLAALDGAAGRRRIELLQRRFGSDEAIREIAARWNVPAQDLHNDYKKARKEFYRCLREVVAFHRPAATDLERECRELLALLG